MKTFREDLVDGLSEEIASCLDGGATLAAVQRGLDTAVLGLSADERTSLLLFAWSYARTRQAVDLEKEPGGCASDVLALRQPRSRTSNIWTVMRSPDQRLSIR